MGYDPLSTTSPAQINVLCLPVGEITAQQFEEYLRALQNFNIVSLRNVPNVTSFASYKDGYTLLNITADIYQADHSASPFLADFNLRPQIVIGLIDGEILSAYESDFQTEWLSKAFTTLQQTSKSFNDTAVCALIILGGAELKLPERIFFVDLEGDGPSLLDAIRELVALFQIQCSIQVRDLQKKISVFEASQNESRPSPNGTAAPVSASTKTSQDRSHSPTTGIQAGNLASNEIRENARNIVLLGQLNLLAGQWPEASRFFSEGGSAARSSTNHVWHAKALEGLLVCMILNTWARLNYTIPTFCFPQNDRKAFPYDSSVMGPICAANRMATESLSSGRHKDDNSRVLTLLLPSLINTILGLYERAAGTFQDRQHVQQAAHSRIRWGTMLLTLKRFNSLIDDIALRSIVEGDNAGSTGENEKSSPAALLLQVAALSKFFINTALEAQSKLPVQISAPIQMAATASLALLKLERRQAFYLRELLRSIGSAFAEIRSSGAAEVDTLQISSSPQLTHSLSTPSGNSSSGIRILFDNVCHNYGLTKIDTSNQAYQDSALHRLQSALSIWSTAQVMCDVGMKLEVLALCIEVSNAIPEPQSTLDLISQLFMIALGTATLHSNAVNPAPAISVSEQTRYQALMHRTVGIGAQQGQPKALARYWDKCLVRFIEVHEEPTGSRLMSRTAHDISIISQSNNEVKKDPFIFNPFSKGKAAGSQLTIVAGEQARFNVVLQNPLQIDVEIEDISLTTEGCDFLADHHSIVLGPLCSQVFNLTGTAHREGTLTITGCQATIKGCHTEQFLIVQGDFKQARTAKHAFTSRGVAIDDVIMPVNKAISLKVISALPQLSIASTSLLQPFIMLLEGEKQEFVVRLHNTSDLDADFVLLTFEDSVTKRLEEMLGKKDLLPADIYEIQNQIANRPVVRLADVENQSTRETIPAGRSVDFVLEVFGRPGLTDITILADFAHLGEAKQALTGSFYTRQIRYTVKTTINGSVDISRCVILPLHEKPVAIDNRAEKPDTQNQEVCTMPGSTELEDGDCLLLLDIRNIWPNPLDVEFHARRPSEEGDISLPEPEHSVTETLQPGQVTRLLLVAPRIFVADPYAPIPSLDTKRQFVVSASKMSLEAEAASRESFWYREHLLKSLRAAWKESEGKRSGLIDMRKGIRLSSRMIDALRVELVDITFSVEASEPTDKKHDSISDGKAIINTAHSRYTVIRNSFVDLVIKVHNRSAESLRLMVRLQPSLRHQAHNVALDLSKRLSWTGVLQRALHPPLAPNEIREVRLGIIGFAVGEYEINATAEEIKISLSRSSTSLAVLGNSPERRIWHARRACQIDIVEHIL